MSYNKANRSDVKKLVGTIEDLAKRLQVKLDSSDGDFLPEANELVRNSSTFVFSLGELYAMEQYNSNKLVSSTVKGNTPRSKNSNYWNVRDMTGRFKSK